MITERVDEGGAKGRRDISTRHYAIENATEAYMKIQSGLPFPVEQAVNHKGGETTVVI